MCKLMCVTIKCFNIIALYTTRKQNNDTTNINYEI